MIHKCLCGARYRVFVGWMAMSFLLMLAGCGDSSILRVIDQAVDGSNEFWVCEGHGAKQCRGQQKNDIDPKGFQKRLQVISPPQQCAYGRVSAMDIVIEGGRVARVRYECGLPDTPTGLPSSQPGLPTSTETPRSN